MDLIIVPDLPLRARVGITEVERAREQDVRVDVELELDLARAGREDSLEHTVDYEKVCDVVASAVQSRSFRLIEALAEASADAVLEAFPVRQVRVRVRKPGALRSRGVPYAAVEIVRPRA